jgi:2-polyprenyl-3-methyl-5-hydroxy-6-metoxy-1,4-benzoquinol methylase
MQKQSSETFEDQVRHYLRNVEGAFSYESMVADHLDVEKYRPWGETIDHYHKIKGSDVFSSGCGSAGDLLVMHEMGARSVAGIEVEDELADLARSRLISAGNINFDISTYAGQELPYDDCSFDIITSIHVIEHVGHVHLYLAELLRVLRPGGILFVDCPNRFYPYEQHTMLKYVHLLPHKLRDVFMKMIAHNKPDVGVSPFRDKCGALIGMKPPFASYIMRCLKRERSRYPHKIEDAYFHDFGSTNIPYSARWHWANPYRVYKHASAFRFIARRTPE